MTSPQDKTYSESDLDVGARALIRERNDGIELEALDTDEAEKAAILANTKCDLDAALTAMGWKYA